MTNATGGGHLESEDFYLLAEGLLPWSRRGTVESHLNDCDDCVETLAMIVRSDRPATREEQELLSTVPEASPEDVARKLHPLLVSTEPRPGWFEWRPIAAAAVLLATMAASAWYAIERVWLPSESRRIAEETLSAMVELRQATGRIPLRYIAEFERASVTRSGFDDSDPAEAALLQNLRSAVDRAPVPEAMLTLALLSLDEGELDDAEVLLKRVLETEPRSADALNGLAVVHYEKAQREPRESYRVLQRGLAFLRQAQVAAPEDLRVLYNFGKYYDALQMRDAAVTSWARYLEKDQASPWAEQAAYELSQLLPSR
jgi:tetratricopeptide (TPR) repeat protein